jgi:hypothetical protein
MGKLKRKIESQERGVEKDIYSPPQYDIPQEYFDILKEYQSGASQLKTAADKSYDVYKSRAYSNMPGYETSKMQLGSSAANAVNRVQESGTGVDSMDAIQKIFQNEINALQDLSVQNAAYKDRGKEGLANAELMRGNAAAQASQLVGAGLSNIAGQKTEQFQMNTLDPYYNQLNYKITQLGNSIAERQARRAFIGNMFDPLFKTGNNFLSNRTNPQMQGSQVGFGSGATPSVNSVDVNSSGLMDSPVNSTPVDTSSLFDKPLST